MALDAETVRLIARLARIKVPEERLPHLAGELSNIIGWVEQLSEVGTEGTTPMTSVVDMTLKTRQDKVTDGDCSDKVLANAPQASRGFYTVPKVVE